MFLPLGKYFNILSNEVTNARVHCMDNLSVIFMTKWSLVQIYMVSIDAKNLDWTWYMDEGVQ